MCRRWLHLVGLVAMQLASKYEENRPYSLKVAEMVDITDDSVTKAQIRAMERLMLTTLKFDLGRPLPLHFLRRASKAANVSLSTKLFQTTATMFTCTQYSGFCRYSEKDNIPTK